MLGGGRCFVELLADMVEQQKHKVIDIALRINMMLEAFLTEDKWNLYVWYNNGSLATHYRYKHCTKAYRLKVIEIFKQMSVNIEVCCKGTKYLLVHGSPVITTTLMVRFG